MTLGKIFKCIDNDNNLYINIIYSYYIANYHFDCFSDTILFYKSRNIISHIIIIFDYNNIINDQTIIILYYL